MGVGLNYPKPLFPKQGNLQRAPQPGRVVLPFNPHMEGWIRDALQALAASRTTSEAPGGPTMRYNLLAGKAEASLRRCHGVRCGYLPPLPNLDAGAPTK